MSGFFREKSCRGCGVARRSSSCVSGKSLRAVEEFYVKCLDGLMATVAVTQNRWAIRSEGRRGRQRITTIGGDRATTKIA